MDIPGVSRRSEAELARFPASPQVGSSFMAEAADLLGDVAGIGAGAMGMNPDYMALLAQQTKTQQEMMVMNMMSNISKSEHETKMAPVRNIRVG